MYCVASESCAFDLIGARFLRDVQPGEVVTLSADGLHSRIVAGGQRQRLLRVRVHLLRAPGHPHGRHRPAGHAGTDGRDPVARGAGAGRHRDRRAGFRQRRCSRPRAGVGAAPGRRLHQEPLRRANLHPARTGTPSPRPATEVQPAAGGGRRPAPGRRRRLDRAWQHDASDRQDAARRRRARGPPAHLGAADQTSVPLRHRHVHARGDDRARTLRRRGRRRVGR